ncbi:MULTISPECIES: formylglycine-generating enzyme family protein [unclassified Microcoleus]|uniref:formylglycine-generating enzyme family protein n=1 Tax=unclassified Microcoleus TaxID=2642155 RepID=UPI002FD58AF3
MTEFTATGNDPKEQEAMKCIQAFRNRFTESHLEFACHAAFPLALTPDLLYRLRDYPFNPKLKVPWIAVSDLLLSDLCSKVDEELYEMDSTVRKILLSGLSQQSLRELSGFLLKYVKRNFHSKITGLKQAQYWTALAYVEPGKAAEQLTQTLRELLQQPNLAQWLQKSSLVETLADPLQAANFEPLLILAEAMKQTALGDYTEATRLFDSLPKTGESAIIAGVEVTLPPRPVPAETFTFETVTVNPQGEIIQREIKNAPYFTEGLGYDTNLEMVYIPRGRFIKGSPEIEAESLDSERPQHQVTIKAFFMGKYPITQVQWQAVARLPKIHYDLDSSPSRFKGENRPVEQISWYHAIEFCARLSQKTGRSYRLPSEVEWEYACRARTTTAFHFGETMTTDLANYRGMGDRENKWWDSYGQGSKGIYRQQTTSVGSLGVANAFGLYDMHGNVWEWCADPWHDRYQGAPTDGTVWDDTCSDRRYHYSIHLLVNTKDDNQTRLLRGGSWDSDPWNCRSACRINLAPHISFANYGFRVVCVAART